MKLSNRIHRRTPRIGRHRAQYQFVKWMQHHEPFLYKVGVRRAQLQRQHMSGVDGMGAIDWSGIFTNISDTIKNIAPTVLQAKQQKQIMDMQMKRAEQGLPPANVEDYTPAIKIQPSFTPESEQAITRVAKATIDSGLTKTLYIVGGTVIFAYVLFGKKRR